MHIWLTEFKGKKVVYCRGILGQYIVSIPEENLVFVRLGHHRKPNYSYEEYKQGKIALNQIDHPRDLYEYLEMVDKIQGSKTIRE
jgi:CubicO group peptidase (beta-lactamase class C family)